MPETEQQSGKQILRTEALRHRARMDKSAESPEKAAKIFFQSITLSQNQVIAGYWPKEHEFDVRPILDELLKNNYKCALPVMQEESKELKFVQFDVKTPLKEGRFGIFQPGIRENTVWIDPDIVIVPFLAFDRRGYRLGHGQGYYDATLKKLRDRKQILAVGVGYAQAACLFNLPAEPHDQKLDWVVTPQGAYNFQDI